MSASVEDLHRASCHVSYSSADGASYTARTPLRDLIKSLPLRVLSPEDFEVWQTYGYIVVPRAIASEAAALLDFLWEFQGMDPLEPESWYAERPYRSELDRQLHIFGFVEGAMNDWTALYLKNVAKAATDLTPAGVGVFSVAMVLARIFSDSWRKHWGDARVVAVGALSASASLAAAVLLHGVVPALAGIALVGLGIGAAAPCVYVAAAENGTDALALVSAMGTVGLLIGPAAIGLIAGADGLGWAMGAVAVAAGVVALCSSRIAWRDAPQHDEGSFEPGRAGTVPAIEPQHIG